MNVFYNEVGIGDTLLISLSTEDVKERTAEKHGDVVKILDEEKNEVVGYNIFNASAYGEIQTVGTVEVTDEIKELIQSAFTKNGIEEAIDIEEKAAFVVGLVETKEKHPNADKLSICSVNVGEETLQIVCGAPNVDEGQRVVVATVGAVMPSGLVIKKAALRGVESSGMICSAKELGLENAPEERGILVLDSSHEIGSAFNMK